MSEMGQSRHIERARNMSAFPPITAASRWSAGPRVLMLGWVRNAAQISGCSLTAQLKHASFPNAVRTRERRKTPGRIVIVRASPRGHHSRLGLRLASAAPADAQLLNHKDLTASIAMTIAQTAIETCKANGYAVSATVVGRNGEIIVQVRGDNTAPHTIENSFRKAYTARTLRSPSGALVDRFKADPTLRLYPSYQRHRLPRRAADQGRRRSYRRGRRVGRTRRREGRSLHQGRDSTRSPIS